MTLRHEINKITGDVRAAVNNIARQGMFDSAGALRGTEKIWGYVCAIHEDGDLAGTIDVQEYDEVPDEQNTMGCGHHEGVLLSAIQDNKDGVQIVPMLFSEVIICRNPIDGKEYVLMYSHAQKIQMLSRSEQGKNDGKVQIGVTEVEKFVETSEGLDKDFDELQPTKNKTSTVYTSSAINDQIDGEDGGYTEEKTAAHKVITVGDTTVTIDGQNVNIQTSSKLSVTIGGTSISQEDGKINIKTDNAVIEGNNTTIKGGNVKITGGSLETQGTSSTDLNGPFNAIKVCPFSGAPHCGSKVSGT